jgi:hypothetical protein
MRIIKREGKYLGYLYIYFHESETTTLHSHHTNKHTHIHTQLLFLLSLYPHTFSSKPLTSKYSFFSLNFHERRALAGDQAFNSGNEELLGHIIILTHTHNYQKKKKERMKKRKERKERKEQTNRRYKGKRESIPP